MDFVSSSPFSLLPPPPFFKIFIIIRIFFNWQYHYTSYIMNNTCMLCPHLFDWYSYKREGMQLHFHISRHIAHLGWETPVFFTLFTLSSYGVLYSTLHCITVTHHLSCWAKKCESFAANGISVNNNLSIVY
jgi:hypothetical protein